MLPLGTLVRKLNGVGIGTRRPVSGGLPVPRSLKHGLSHLVLN